MNANIEPENYTGDKFFPDEIDAYIAKELKKGTLIGSFDTNPFGDSARISPLNSHPKKEGNECRMIIDLSFPEGKAVNRGVSKSKYRGCKYQLHLPIIDSLIRILHNKHRHVLLFKCNLKAVYKQVFICDGEIHLLGYIHRGHYYFDFTLPTGLTNSAHICQHVTDMLIYIYNSEGYSGLNYLDDLVLAETEALAEQTYATMGDILSCVG